VRASHQIHRGVGQLTTPRRPLAVAPGRILRAHTPQRRPSNEVWLPGSLIEYAVASPERE
jgi:hypothetical protein